MVETSRLSTDDGGIINRVSGGLRERPWRFSNVIRGLSLRRVDRPFVGNVNVFEKLLLRRRIFTRRDRIIIIIHADWSVDLTRNFVNISTFRLARNTS